MTEASLLGDGFVRLPGVLDSETIESLRCSAKEYREEQGPFGVIVHDLWQRDPTVEALVRDGGLAALVRNLLRVDEVVFFQDHLVWKPVGADVTIEWHQDYSYWPLDAPAGLTVWFALDDTDPENGCLRYIPGTHRMGERQPADFIRGTDQPPIPGLPPLTIAEHEGRALDALTAAGDALAHHPLAWHMSGPNTSGRERRAWSTTWILPDVRWDPDHAPHPFLYSLKPRSGVLVAGDRFPLFSPQF